MVSALKKALESIDAKSVILGILLGGGGSSGLPGAAGMAARAAQGAGIVPGGTSAQGGAKRASIVPMEPRPSPDNYLDYKVINIPGTPQFNAGLNRGADPAVYRQQTAEAHNAALNAYTGIPNIPEATALQMGRTDERALPSFWDDAKLRQDVHPTSSAIAHVRLTPDNRIEVQWGSAPKWYTYTGGADRAQTADMAAQLIQSNSLGQTLAPALRSAWRQNHYDMRFNGVGRSRY